MLRELSPDIVETDDVFSFTRHLPIQTNKLFHEQSKTLVNETKLATALLLFCILGHRRSLVGGQGEWHNIDLWSRGGKRLEEKGHWP